MWPPMTYLHEWGSSMLAKVQTKILKILLIVEDQLLLAMCLKDKLGRRGRLPLSSRAW